ncbi:MAG TPA: polyprenol monophosphomannose synthase [Candidatus Paceibacterota bacterium]
MKTIIAIPTYNESLNIEELIRQVFRYVPDTSILIVDDSSPDGTGQIVRNLQKEFTTLELYERPHKMGLGSAYVETFEKAIKNQVDAVITMDADFSHDPKYLPEMIRILESEDVVIGSRYIPGGGTGGWNAWRKFLSKYGNKYYRFITRIPIHDCSGGFNGIRINMLKKLDFPFLLTFKGYSWQLAFRFSLYKLDARMKEIPIFFRNRVKGQSKLSNQIIREALLTPWRLIFRKS